MPTEVLFAAHSSDLCHMGASSCEGPVGEHCAARQERRSKLMQLHGSIDHAKSTSLVRCSTGATSVKVTSSLQERQDGNSSPRSTRTSCGALCDLWTTRYTPDTGAEQPGRQTNSATREEREPGAGNRITRHTGVHQNLRAAAEVAGLSVPVLRTRYSFRLLPALHRS